jgi:uncharacterized Ntn-hydrolase superfamily protein
VSRPTKATIATFSIVACDLEAREWGVAVESKFLAVGAAVPFAEAETGAVATQARADLSYGPRGLDLLRRGLSADDVVAELVAGDPDRDDRQLGVVDGQGRTASYTGTSCLDWAGGTTGPCFAAQGNILTSEETVLALARRFEETADRPLAERLLACLGAAQAAGGDRRGQQSSSLLVVRRGAGYGGTSDQVVDLRVDDHPTPVAELERIYGIHQLLFGQTPREQWIEVDDELRAEIEDRLRSRGYVQTPLLEAFDAWVATENLEERADGVERMDPVVLAALREDVVD